MNKRKRIPKVLDAPEEQSTRTKLWTNNDKCNLLKGLRMYGHTDIDSISTLLPSKTKPAIKLMIHKIMQKAKSISYHDNPALKSWIKTGMFDDKTYPVPQMLKFISLFEKHPSPDESNGFDFKAAYDHLHRMTLGLPPINLPGNTQERINDLMEEIKAEVWPKAEDEILGYVSTLDMKARAPMCYPPKKRLRIIKSDDWPNTKEGSKD